LSIQFGDEPHSNTPFFTARRYTTIDMASTTALAIHSKRDKMEAKKQLLKDVVDWITMNEQEAKEEFEKSAGEVITILRKIEAKN
jgi:hypothetical protein